MIAEAVGHATVADQLRARFLGPLGLDHTYYQAVEQPRGPVVHDYRFLGTSAKLPAIDLSDGTAVVPFTSVVTAAGAAGSIATTATDLAHWAQALYAGPALDRPTRAAMVDDACGRPGSSRASPMGSGSSQWSWTASRRLATQAVTWGRGSSFAGCRTSAWRSPS